MKIQITKMEAGYMHMDYSNNLHIGTGKKEISLNIKGASFVKDEDKLLLTIVGNITIEIDYTSDKKEYGFGNSPIYKLREDYGNMRQWITDSRKNKMRY